MKKEQIEALELETLENKENIDFNMDETSFDTDTVFNFGDSFHLPVLTQKEVYYLLQEAQNGNKEAKEKLILYNLRLVASIAHRYVISGVSVEDLIQEGIIGLTTAIDKFDCTKEVQFSTYATVWIYREIQSYIINQSQSMAISRNSFFKIKKMPKVEQELTEKLGRTPTKQEVAQTLQISVQSLENLKKLDYKEVSINQRVNQKDYTTLENFLKDDHILPSEYVNQQVMNELVHELLHHLNEREEKVIRLRFGLEDGETHTLVEIGKMYGTTRECIRL